MWPTSAPGIAARLPMACSVATNRLSAWMGWRRSWLATARNRDLAWLAASACSLALRRLSAALSARMRRRSRNQLSRAAITLAAAPSRATSCSLLMAMAVVKLGSERAVSVQL